MTLSKDEMNIDDLAVKAQNGDIEAYEQLFKNTSWIIYKLAKQYGLNREDYEDLVSLGLVLFSETLETFNRKCAFKARLYSVCKDRFINYSVRKQHYLVKVPMPLADLCSRLAKFKRRFREATDEECIEFLGVTEEIYKRVKAVECAKNSICCDGLKESVSGRNTEYEAINNVMTNQAIKESGLTKKEADVIQMLYFCDLPAIEISKILGISRMQVYNRKNEALKKMRKRLM